MNSQELLDTMTNQIIDNIALSSNQPIFQVEKVEKRICKKCQKSVLKAEAVECKNCRRIYCADHITESGNCEACYRLKYGTK